MAARYLGLAADFPKSDELDLAEEWLDAEDGLRADVRAWIAWLEVRDARPPCS